MAKILVIEDEVRVSQLLKRGLEESDHVVNVADCVSIGLNLFENNSYDIVVSDVLLPDGSGFEVCRKIREKSESIPILMLTALGATDDKLEGFHSGADDYMVKPFDFRELDARIHILLKRKPPSPNDKMKIADLTINLKTKSVHRGDVHITLTPKEYNLLLFFVHNHSRVISRTEIAENVWNTHFDTGTNFIDVYINYLRKKIDKNFSPKLIHTKPGMGFIFGDENTY